MGIWTIIGIYAGVFGVSYVLLAELFSRLFDGSNDEILVNGTTTTLNNQRALYASMIIIFLAWKYIHQPYNESIEQEKIATHQTAIEQEKNITHQVVTEHETIIKHNGQNISSLYVAAHPIMFKLFTDLKIKDNVYYKKSFLTEHGKKKLLLLIIPFVLIIFKIFFKVEFLKNFYPILIFFLMFFVVSGAYTQYFLDNQDQYINSLKDTEKGLK